MFQQTLSAFQFQLKLTEHRVLKFSPTWEAFPNYFKDDMGTDLISRQNPLSRSLEDNFVLAVEFYDASVINFTISSSITFLSNVNKRCCSTILSH